jgi:hypothetical protein
MKSTVKAGEEIVSPVPKIDEAEVSIAAGGKCKLS